MVNLETTLTIPVGGTGVHFLEIRNRRDKNPQSAGYVLRFQNLTAQPIQSVETLDYDYDAVARLRTVLHDTLHTETYGYDLAGNLINDNGITRLYNTANQLTQVGATALTYDDNGNLVNDGTNCCAGRLGQRAGVCR